jgi:hypothetical protein
MPVDWWTPGAALAGASNLNDWQRAGGFDANTLLYGNWSHIAWWSARNAIVESNYHYRNVPLSLMNPWHAYDDGNIRADAAAGAGGYWRAYSLPGVSPVMPVKLGQPYFPTTKLLGNRSIMSDTFSKGATYDALGNNVTVTTLADSQKTAGMGVLAHRDGYNVLYGDWSARWYGDPQQAIMWHTQGTGPSTGTKTIYYMAQNYFYGYKGGGWSYGIDHDYFRSQPNAVWHDFDTANNVDGGVDLGTAGRAWNSY